MARFKNEGEPIDLYRPAGHAESCHVDAGQVVEIVGEITSETDDAYIVGEGDTALAFPKSRWSVDAPKSTRSSAARSGSEES